MVVYSLRDRDYFRHMKNIEEEWYVLYIYTVGVQAEKRQGFHLFCLFLAHHSLSSHFSGRIDHVYNDENNSCNSGPRSGRRGISSRHRRRRHEFVGRGVRRRDKISSRSLENVRQTATA